MKRSKNWLIGLFLSFFALLVVLVAAPYVFDTVPADYHTALVEAFSKADSVSLSYCKKVQSNPESEDRTIQVSEPDVVKLSPDEFKHLRDLLQRRHFFFGSSFYPRCWEPNHVIRIEEQGKPVLNIYVCFTCLKYQVGDRQFRSIPKTLRVELQKIFAAKGLTKHLDGR